MHKAKRWLIAGILLLVLIVSGVYLSRVNIPVLEPKGPIADKEFRLLVTITSIMLIVVIPVFVLLFYVVWRYREDNPRRGKYVPEWEHSRLLEGLWWIIPAILITIVSVISWHATYALNPYNPIPSKNKAIDIQVISMDWKWLFIYPRQHIASVNLFEMPVNTPVHFYLTSDAPMNAFWLPQLSGQIFTMAGMQTQLYIMANVKGSYVGRSANISGIGFASMQFTAKAVSNKSFNIWVNNKRNSSPKLTIAAYKALDRPSSYVAPRYYSDPAKGLFIDVIGKYIIPAGQGVAL